MRTLMIVAGLAAVVPAALLAGSARDDDQAVVVAVVTYGADGTVRSSASTGGEATFGSRVYALTSGCGVGAGESAIPRGPATVWRVFGQVVTRSTDSVTADIRWQRVTDAGEESGQADSRRVVLRASEVVRVDGFDVETPGACSAVVALEARLGPAATDAMSGPRGGGRGSGRGGVGAGGGGGLSVGASGGRSGTTYAGATEAWRAEGNGRGGRGGRGSISALPSYTVEAWFVRKPPVGEEVTAYQRTSAPALLGMVRSGPMIVPLGGSQLQVEISGVLSTRANDLTGEPELRIWTSRVIGERASTGGALQVLGQGTGNTVVGIPAPDDVVAIELPPIRLRDGRTLPDVFTVRLKLTPVK